MKYKILLFILAIVVSFGIWMTLINQHQQAFGAQAIPFHNSWWFIAYGFIVTMIGVFLGSTYRALQALKEKGETQIGKVSAFFHSILTSIDLWIGIVGAPIVYALLWKSMETVSVAGLTIVALQNGFCCTLIIANLMRRQADGGNEKPNNGGAAQ
jgi:hypothetical protein